MGKNRVSKNVWVFGGAIGALGLYVTYFAGDMASKDNTPDNGLMVNDLLTSVIASTLSVGTALFLAMRDQRTTAPVSVAIVMEGFQQIPGVEAGVGEKIKQSFDHMKAKVIQAYEHQKHYDTLGEWFDAANRKADRVIPEWLRKGMSGSRVGVTMNDQGVTVTVQAGGGPEIPIYKSEKPATPPPAETPSFQDPPAEYARPHVHHVEKQRPDPFEEAENAGLESALDQIASATSKGVKRVVGGASVLFSYNERMNDPVYEDADMVARRTCAVAGTVVEDGLLTAASGAAGLAAAEFPPAVPSAVVAANMLAGDTADRAGDSVQSECHKVFNKKRK